MQLDSKLTFEKAITKARQSETVEKQQTFLQETKSEPPPVSVDRLSKGKENSKDDMRKKRPLKPPKPQEMGRILTCLKHNVQGTAWVNYTKRDNVQPENQNVSSVPKKNIGQTLADHNQTR